MLGLFGLFWVTIAAFGAWGVARWRTPKLLGAGPSSAGAGTLDRLVAAVEQVESGGLPALVGRWALMRVELHHVWRAWPARYRAGLDALIQVRGPKPWEGHTVVLPAASATPTLRRNPFVPISGGRLRFTMHTTRTPWRATQALEQATLGLLLNLASTLPTRSARSTAREAVFASTSWGVAQLLGSHYAALGYSSAEKLATAFSSSTTGAVAQRRGLRTWLESQPAALAALVAQDWFGFAVAYNGPGKPADYAAKLERAYRRLA